MHEQDIEERESSDPVQSEDLMTARRKSTPEVGVRGRGVGESQTIRDVPHQNWGGTKPNGTVTCQWHNGEY
ncbi:hypothetical protein TNCV_3137501 [Trichonephila clavipes]|nr:hypothetical protein TNCV_3137501 [Trichonephila clavipes]